MPFKKNCKWRYYQKVKVELVTLLEVISPYNSIQIIPK